MDTAMRIDRYVKLWERMLGRLDVEEKNALADLLDEMTRGEDRTEVYRDFRMMPDMPHLIRKRAEGEPLR